MNCTACQREVIETAKFCEHCGHRLLRNCPECGHEIRLSAKFCEECGAGLGRPERNGASAPSPPPDSVPDPADSGDLSSPLLAPSAEWRQLTVVFCDLVDSTPLSSRLDPEEYREIIKAYQKACGEAIKAFGGHVAQYLGDGLLIYFGYPMAAEDAPRSAIRAGLGILEAMGWLNSRLERERGLRLAVRIGIHTGMVVVGDVGDGEKREHLALGEAPNVAARIQSSAEPDTVVVSETTLSLVPRRFAYRELGAPPLKGQKKPLALFRILGESEESPLETAFGSSPTPMVGRRNEIELLVRCWNRAMEGQGQLVVLSGGAGIGKSRLLRAFHERLAGAPSLRVEYRCSPLARNSALSPVIDGLQRSWGLGTEEPAETRLVRLESRLSAYSFPQRESVPLLAALLAIPLPDGRYPPLPMSPQRQWRRTQQILVEALLEDSERLPLLLVWEDLHWADPSSLELIDQVVVQVPTARVFFLSTCRPSPLPPGSSLSHATRLTIECLNRPQVEEMITGLCRGKSLPKDMVDLLVERTDGVPLYVEELTKMVLGSELLHETDDGWELAGPLPALAVPSSLQDSLMARLDRLAPAREVVHVAAVLGREFSYRLLAAVSKMNEEDLSRILAKLVKEDLLHQRGVPPESRYAFKHVLIQQTAYRSLLKSTRHRYHSKIARVLVKKLPESGEVHSEQVAHHFTEAGLFEKAVRFWQEAGTEAAQRSAYREAIHHLYKGLELLGELPASPDRTRLELALNVSLGEPLTFVRGESDPAVEGVFFRSWQLCQELGEDPQLFPALFGLLTHYLARAELPTVRDLSRQVLRLAERGNQPAQLFSARFALGMAASVSGELVSGLRHYEEAITLTSATAGPLDAALRLLLVRCLCLSSWNLWLLGHPDQALARLHEAEAQARAVPHPFGRALVLATIAMLRQLRREPGEVSAPAREAVRLSQEQGFPIMARIGTILEGWAQVELERDAGGLGRIRGTLDAWRATGYNGMLPYIFLLLAEACRRLGRLDDGLAAVTDALALIEETRERLWEAELHRLRGEFLLQVPSAGDGSREARAETCFQRALGLARDQRAGSLELRAARSLGRLWRSQGKSEEARDVLAKAHGGFTEGFRTADLEEARALLDELS